jgi:murein DD-endopeptidase MepM/ murein hydrolase activator NlpD
MQLMWLSGPLGAVRSLSVSRAGLAALAACVALMLLAAGNLLHYVGLRLALEYRPELVRAIGVLTADDLERIEATYRQRVAQLRGEIAAVGREVAELRTLKDEFARLALPRHYAAGGGRPGAPPRPADRRRDGDAAAPATPAAQPTGPAPAGDADPPLPGRASFFGDLEASRRDLRSGLRTVRHARAEWAAQLAWLDALPTGPPIAGGAPISSRFGLRGDPFTGRPSRHDGVDFAAPSGTPIVAAATGTVLRSQRHPAYGLIVDIDHGNGYRTRYAHASALLVRPGERVARGAPIATVGSTGRSTGPHLHFEVMHRGAVRDPEPYLVPDPDASAALEARATVR